MESSELASFISAALAGIAKGIGDANAALKATDAKRQNAFALRPSTAGSGKGDAFDIAVIAARGHTEGAGFKLSVASIGANAGSERERSHASEHRIQFEVSLTQVVE